LTACARRQTLLGMSSLLAQLVFAASPDDGETERSLHPRWQVRTAEASEHEHEDDARLATRVRCGDQAAFKSLFAKYYDPLVRIAAVRVDGETAADAVADVFAHLWDSHATWKPENVEAYLFRSVRNRVLDLVRTTTREHRRRELAVQLEPRESEPSALVTDEKAVAVEMAVTELGVRQQEFVVLRWQQGRSTADIAQLTGSSARAMTSLQDRILATLRRRAPEILAELRSGKGSG
jgi:RNA polymerase sigma factor (sigma-70 family)